MSKGDFPKANIKMSSAGLSQVVKPPTDTILSIFQYILEPK